MGTIKSFEQIEAWKKARILTRKIYEVSKQGPFRRDFSLRDQCRRASVSIMANIAEGFERGGTKEFIHFLSIVKASTAELRSHFYVGLDQGYFSEDVFDEIYALARETSQMIWGLMRYLSGSSIKGSKFK